MTATRLVRALHRAGWYDDEQSGAHLSLRHPNKAGKVVVPIHKGKDLKLRTLASILNDAGLTPDELRRLLCRDATRCYLFPTLTRVVIRFACRRFPA
ncbi:MAG: type II toxin-antitoxin system HicA family toxin [Chloroflexi bacterium]|nr:type II toxin-antitoxin system HicA family toxin [Chloroflexota bacterium]